MQIFAGPAQRKGLRDGDCGTAGYRRAGLRSNSCPGSGAQVGLGSHEELMRTCPMYRELYHLQVGEEVEAV